MKLFIWIYCLILTAFVVVAWDLNHLQAISVGLGMGLVSATLGEKFV